MDVLQMTRELGKAIQQDDLYLQYTLAQQASDNDEELQTMIGQFNLLRTQINQEMVKPEKDTMKIDELNKQLQENYQSIMKKPNMIAFNAAKQGLDVLMNHINAVLTGSLNGDNPDEIDVEAACAGDCSACGGSCG